jgi:hypothetical protein
MSVNEGSIGVILSIAIALAIVAVLLLQSLGKTTVRVTTTCRRSHRQSDRTHRAMARTYAVSGGR